jgi:hypothetical protein
MARSSVRVGAAALLLLATLLAPRRAEMGQIHIDEANLDQLLAQTPIIAVVEPGEPFMQRHSLDLGQGIPPYEYAVSTYQVVEYLRPPRAAAEGETITLTGFDDETLDLHLRYYVQGVSKSPIWRSYIPAHPPATATERQILFLRRGAFLRYDPAAGKLEGRADTMILAMRGAVEGFAARDQIAGKAAKAPGCSDRLDLTIGAPGVTDIVRDAIDKAVQQRFADEGGFGWTVVDLRPGGAVFGSEGE